MEVTACSSQQSALSIQPCNIPEYRKEPLSPQRAQRAQGPQGKAKEKADYFLFFPAFSAPPALSASSAVKGFGGGFVALYCKGFC
ncbi:MAG: hypothetical protein LAP21_22525 [Acidobacteriia bacterium]|nr:hypothetical protein [Terriglobia bacterium]